MKTYTVTIVQQITETYEIEVEAADEDGARAEVDREIEHGLDDANKVDDYVDSCDVTEIYCNDDEDDE